MMPSEPLASLAAVAIAAALSGIGVWAIRPLLLRYALARPNARSSHLAPTPQGAGIAVIAATLMVAGCFIALADGPAFNFPAVLFGAAIAIAVLGAVDDVRPIPVLPRLLLQGVCAAAVIYAAGNGRIWDYAPPWLERALLFLAVLWFVNLVNFMDGIDLITVAEVAPVTAALAILGWIGVLSPLGAMVAAALGGAMLGFAPFNRPVARVFLGDVGSLPIGLLLAWCFIELAYRQQLVAALLLPLYYLADATVTLLRRLIRGDPVWVAHRGHFYQRATDNGFSVSDVVRSIFVLNIGLAALAIGSTLIASSAVKLSLLLVGGAAVGLLMRRFSRRKV